MGTPVLEHLLVKVKKSGLFRASAVDRSKMCRDDVGVRVLFLDIPSGWRLLTGSMLIITTATISDMSPHNAAQFRDFLRFSFRGLERVVVSLKGENRAGGSRVETIRNGGLIDLLNRATPEEAGAEEPLLRFEGMPKKDFDERWRNIERDVIGYPEDRKGDFKFVSKYE